MMRALFILLMALSASGATKYLRQGATGAANGNNWTDAYTTLSALETGLARGDTGYIADGSYAGATMNTAASETTAITIKKATEADHGAAGDWDSSYGDGQATFTSAVTFNTSNWEFNGVIGDGASVWPVKTNVTDYGFAFPSSVNKPFFTFNTSIAISNITIASIGWEGSTSDVEKIFVSTDNSTKAVNFLTIRKCLSRRHNNFHWMTSPADDHYGGIVEYNVVQATFSSASWHGEDFNNNFGTLVDWHYRYNWLQGIGNAGNAPTMIMGALNNDSGPLFVYGNVFLDKEYTDGGICAVDNGQGTHTLTGEVYNNTFINCDDDAQIIGGAGNNQMTVHNNIFVDMEVSEGTSGTYSHNSYWNCASTPAGESNAQTIGSDPFEDYSGRDYDLETNTSAGTTTSRTTDAKGNAFNISGTWSRGAFAFVEQGGGAGVSGATAVCIAANGRVRGRR